VVEVDDQKRLEAVLPGSASKRRAPTGDSQAPAMSASQQVADASSVLGLLLAIVALFTVALSSTLQSESTRQGGPHRGAWRRIMGLALALAVISAATLASLTAVVRVVLDAHGTSAWQPAFWVFLLVYLLLLPLCAWQVVIAVGALRMRPKR